MHSKRLPIVILTIFGLYCIDRVRVECPLYPVGINQVNVKGGAFFMGTEYTGGGEGAGAPPDGGLPRNKVSLRQARLSGFCDGRSETARFLLPACVLMNQARSWGRYFIALGC